MDGIHLYEYELPSDELLNSTQDPGFFADGPSGVLNITAVAPSNAPLFISKPHFLHADPDFLKNVTGLHPNSAIHDSHLDVEPLTGEQICLQTPSLYNVVNVALSFGNYVNNSDVWKHYRAKPSVSTCIYM